MPARAAGTGGPGTLAGTRVLDLTSLVPGAYATRLLADLGADVLKLERPSPAPFPSLGGWAPAVSQALDGGKRSLAVNLKHPRGAALVRELAGTADVLLEGFRPGVAARLGLGYRDLAGSCPRLVYCSLTGYGQTGARAGEAGHDLNYLAVTGLLSLTANPGQAPVLLPTLLADLAGGAMAALGILAGLAARERTGQGSYLDVPLAGVVASWLPPGVRDRAGFPLAGQYACYTVWETGDGRHVALAALEPRFWENFCRAAGREDLLPAQFSRASDPAWAELAGLFKGRSREEWTRLAAGKDLCLTPVLDPIEAGTDGGPGLPFAAGGIALDQRRHPPRRGEHTREVLEGLGLPGPAIDDLAAGGVIELED